MRPGPPWEFVLLLALVVALPARAEDGYNALWIARDKQPFTERGRTVAALKREAVHEEVRNRMQENEARTYRLNRLPTLRR